MAVVSLFHTTSVTWIPYMVGTLFIISFGGVMLIFSLCVFRRFKSKREAKVLDIYREKLISIVCAENDQDLPVINPHSWERPLVRNLLLTTINSVQGDGKVRLMKIYQDLLFLAHDYVGLNSSSFAIKLGALARLETVRDSVASKVVVRLLEDKSPYVHFAALRFLLKKNQGFSPAIEVEMENLEKLRRYDMALEILNCYAHACPEEFLQFLTVTSSPRIRMAALEIVYKKRMVHALEYVRDSLMAALHPIEFKFIHIQEFKKAIQCLAISPMPENEELLIELSQGSVAEVRSLAFRAWLQMRPDLFADIIDKMSQDPSESIQKMAHQLRQRNEASLASSSEGAA